MCSRIQHSDESYAPIVLPQEYTVLDPAGAIQPLPVNSESGNVPGREARHDATQRVAGQATIWDLVQLRRALYFGSIALGLLLTVFPLMFAASAACTEELWCFLSDWVKALQTVLPEFVAPWIDAYASHPFKFILLVLALAGLLYWSARERRRMNDLMRAVWLKKTIAPSSGWRRVLAKLYEPFASIFSRAMVPLASLAVLLTVFGLVSQLGFRVTNSAGAYCESTPGVPTVGWPHRFQVADELCKASGVQLREGVTYELSLQLKDVARSKDGAEAVGVRGYAHEPASGLVRVPFRRHMTEPWLAPIARVGETGTDEYALRASGVYTEPGSDKQLLVSRITARTSGELFMFVNDAVYWPFFFKRAYGSGARVLEVSVQPVETWRSAGPANEMKRAGRQDAASQ